MIDDAVAIAAAFRFVLLAIETAKREKIKTIKILKQINEDWIKPFDNH